MGFSVVMPTYQREHTIQRALNSIYAQTYVDWELIVVDNYGSGYSFDDERVKYHVYTGERGDGPARNYGIPFATKDLLCFFDDDDYMLPTYMERFAEAFGDPKVMIARCKMRLGLADRVDLATPQLVVRREFANAKWEPGLCLYNDKMYWGSILEENGWTTEGPEFKEIDEMLVQAMPNPKGGYREAGP